MQAPVLKGHEFSRANQAFEIDGALAPERGFSAEIEFFRSLLSCGFLHFGARTKLRPMQSLAHQFQ
jgi:hypothetical protein